uniref:Nuclear RNA export factor 1 n=1 Tax=Sarcophilus harrisii TaxID=9305 RepID=A0A7N4UYJ9_SARHA
MSKRYDGSQQALDLKGLRTDPDLVAQNIDVILNRRNCMSAALRIIEENIPELLSLNLSNNRLYRLDDFSEIVQKAPNLKILNLSGNELKSERELDKVKRLKLDELWLVGNPLCDAFRDQSSYISLAVFLDICPTPWYVLAQAGPHGRAGHHLRQLGPWAPTPFPPPLGCTGEYEEGKRREPLVWE